MIEIIQNIIILIAFAGVHEIGHYVAYRFFGIKPKIKIYLLWIEIGGNVLHKTTIFQGIIIASAGIIAGMPIIFIDKWLGMTYLLMCCIDITLIMTWMNGMKTHSDKTIIEWNEHEIKRIKRDDY